MLLDISMQFKIIICSLAAGILVGILFDMYRIIRNFNKVKLIVIVEDILFWILAALVIFTFLLYINYALFTPYVYMFIIIALLLYLKFFSNHFYTIERYFVSTIYKIIRVLIKNIIYPIKLVIYKITDANK